MRKYANNDLDKLVTRSRKKFMSEGGKEDN